MERLCREAEREGPRSQGGFHWSTRTAAALLAAVLGTTVAMAAVYHFRMVRVDHEKYSNIRYEQVEDGYIPGEFVAYHITYIPEGFTQTQDRTTGTEHQETYVNVEGKGIRLRQLRIDIADLDIDTEKVKPVEILLNGTQRVWYLGNQSIKVVCRVCLYRPAPVLLRTFRTDTGWLNQPCFRTRYAGISRYRAA